MDKQHIYDEFSDQELLHYLGQDDYRAFTTLYQRYIDVLFPYSRSLNLDEMDADDSIQEVFTHLWLRRSTLQIDNLSAWLFMSIRKQMLYQLRKKKYRDRYVASAAAYISPFYDSVLEVLHEKELQQYIQQEIAKLPPRMQEIFRMSRMEYLSHKQIAEKLGLSETTVRKQISNVLKIFRYKLGRIDAGIIILLASITHKNNF